MRRSDFAYELPKYLIAQEPLPHRSSSRLLRLDGATGEVVDGFVTDLAELLAPGDLLVFNDTRVLRARLYARRPTGGRVEILIERVMADHRAIAQLRPARIQRPGAELTLDDGSVVEVLARRPDDLFEIAFRGERNAYEVMESVGLLPLPPYIEREPHARDDERYQTIYSRQPGAIAAPTAGLHFDEKLLDRLAARGVEWTFITLHVGSGTFAPVRVEHVVNHRMHSERIEVGAEQCEAIIRARSRGNRVIAVGTTSVRALETMALRGSIAPIATDTDIFITPGFRFRLVDALITNFHLPESTLLMLVCAYAGTSQVLAAYQHAVRQRYRFFSYGDAMFVTPAPGVLDAL